MSDQNEMKELFDNVALMVGQGMLTGLMTSALLGHDNVKNSRMYNHSASPIGHIIQAAEDGDPAKFTDAMEATFPGVWDKIYRHKLEALSNRLALTEVMSRPQLPDA